MSEHPPETFDFEHFRRLFKNAISEALSKGENHLMIDVMQSANKSVGIGEIDRRMIWDQSFRDQFVSESLAFSVSGFETLLELGVHSATAQICSPTLPVILLTDAFDVLPLQACEDIFYIVEVKVATWKQELFFNHCKNSLLRLCNDLLRRLSRSQNTVFCGRILLFLAKFFPFSERSGLNVVSEFNLENFTSFGVKEEAPLESSMEDNKEDMEVDPSLQIDYNLYKKFWSLQDFFRNPNQCYLKIPWKTFCSHTNDVLSAFATIKLDEQQKGQSQTGEINKEGNMCLESDTVKMPCVENKNVQQYFAKYLTSLNLLELQLGDSNFRRYILLQFLIMFQYLESPVKFKNDSQKLNEEQIALIAEASEKVYRLLEDTPPDGSTFAKSIHHILKREELWSNWKNEGCREFRLVATRSCADEEVKNDNNAERKVPGRPRRARRHLGDQIRDASRRNKCIIGNVELNRLWNLCPDNMAACRSKERDFLPTLESYFEEAIEQLDPSIENQYKRVNEANFGWRALRLLARRSLHFFTHGNTPITRLPDYLETHVKKLAKDMQSSVALHHGKSESIEDGGDVEQMEPEADPVTSTEIDGTPEESSGKVEEGEENHLEEEVGEKKPVLCTIEQLTILAQKLGSNWKLLALKLGFKSDEVEYFESETKSFELQAQKMLQIWVENESDATPENLMYTLEGLGLSITAEGVF